MVRGVTSEDAAGVPLMDGQEKLQELVHLPRTWPLARLTIPLEGLSKQIDRLLEGYCFQILDLAAVSGIPQQCTTHPTEPLFRKGSWLHGVGQGCAPEEGIGVAACAWVHL